MAIPPGAGGAVTVHVEGSDPYPWPYDGRLVGHRLALVLAGWDESWAGRVLAPAPAIEAGEQLAEAVEAAGGLVLGVAHQGSPALAVRAGGSVVPAHGIDGFHGGPLDDVLRASGRTHLLVCGLGLEGPVHSTLRSANDRGYECLLVVDASGALTAELAGAAAKTVTMSGGIFGAVGRLVPTLRALARALTPVRQGDPT